MYKVVHASDMGGMAEDGFWLCDVDGDAVAPIMCIGDHDLDEMIAALDEYRKYRQA